MKKIIFIAFVVILFCAVKNTVNDLDNWIKRCLYIENTTINVSVLKGDVLTIEIELNHVPKF